MEFFFLLFSPLAWPTALYKVREALGQYHSPSMFSKDSEEPISFYSLIELARIAGVMVYS